MARVFIAYSRDDREFVDRLVADLNAAGVPTWRDVDDIPSDVAAYVQGWRESVDRALEECTHMVVVLSPEAVDSAEVSAEWNAFLGDRRPVYPVIHRQTRVPYRLRALQVRDLRRDYDAQLADLIAVLPHTKPAPAPAVPARRGVRPLWMWIGGGVAAVAVVSGMLALALGAFGGGSPPAAEPTPTEEAVEEATPVAEEGIPRVTANAEWTPVIQEFDGVEMALVPAGCFMMGSEDGPPDEQPVHEQCFYEPFWIDVYEVTNSQYGSASDNCLEWSSGDNQPRICVDWFQAVTHCQSRRARLPTEAEWEYAARGPDGLVYPWGDDFVAGNVVYASNSYNQAAEVGRKPLGASWVGALDMSGNVWEWVSSIYQDYPYQADDGREVDGSIDSSSARVLRGGSWSSVDGLSLRGNLRFRYHPATSFSFLGIGFRCVRDYEP